MNPNMIIAALETLDNRSAKIALSNSGNSFFDKIAKYQKNISDKTRALVTLGTAASTKESESVWKAAAKLHDELDKTAEDTKNTSLVVLAAMETNFYERTRLELNSYGGEIRELVRSMDSGRRMQFIQTAIEKADVKVLAAIIHADVPAVLSGFSDDDRLRLREQLFELLMPEAIAVREAYRDFVDLVNSTIVFGRMAVDDFGNQAKLKAHDEATAAKVSARATLEAVM